MSVITVTSYWGIIGYTVLGEYHWMEQYKVYVQLAQLCQITRPVSVLGFFLHLSIGGWSGPCLQIIAIFT